eukprot:c8214_g1_i1.p1 GENE.c8214_g1_i1~~c8214_g1_i1.p1  ORF type:complete len:390 (-),score=103.24 c8214_g1_i1:60-1229(-)
MSIDIPPSSVPSSRLNHGVSLPNMFHHPRSTNDDGEASETMSVTSLTSDLESHEDSVALMVRKLNVFKKSLVSERQKVKLAEERCAEATNRVLAMEQLMKEKDEIMKQLRDKNSQLMQQIANEDANIPQNDNNSKKKSKKELEQENMQMREEVRVLSERLRTANSSLPDQSLSHHVATLKADNAQLNQTVEQMKSDRLELEAHYGREVLALEKLNSSMAQQHGRMNGQILDLTSKLRLAENKITEQQTALESQKQTIDQLTSEIDEQRLMNKQLGKKLNALKLKQDQLELPMRRYQLKEIVNGKERPAELGITKNPKSHSLVIEVTTNSRPVIFDASGILEANRTGDQTFALRCVNSPLRVFSTENVDEVLSSIRLFMHVAAEQSNPNV